MPDLLTVCSPNHQRILVEGVWNSFSSKHRVDLDVTCNGRSPRSAHQLILDVFLPSLSTKQEPADRETCPSVDLGFALTDDNDLDLLLEFVYRGQVTLDRQQMQNLLGAAKNLNLQILVDAIEDCERSDLTSAVNPEMLAVTKGGDAVLQFEGQEASRRKRKRTPIKFVKLWDVPAAGDEEETPLVEPVRKRRGRPPKIRIEALPMQTAKRTPKNNPTSKVPVRSRRVKVETSEESDVNSDITDEEEGNMLSGDEGRPERHDSEIVPEGDSEGRDTVSKYSATVTKKKQMKRQKLQRIDGEDSKQARSEYKKLWRQTRPVLSCDYCDYHTRDKIRFNIHSAKHDSTVVIFKCGDCGRIFQSRESLERHELTHLGTQEMYQCTQCSYTSPKKINYHRHITAIHKIAADGKPLPDKYCCDDCTFVCMYKSQYKLHRMMKHSSEKHFKCPYTDCAYASIRKGDLEKHVSIVHLRNRNYMCDFCGFCSTHKGALNRHIRSHSKEKPYTCGTCGQSYADSHKLKTHLRRHLNDEKPFVCHLCGHCCRRKDNLQMHMKRIHKATLDNEALM